MSTPAEKWLETKRLIKEWKATTYLARLNAWISPKDSAKWLCPAKEVNSFIEAMQPMVKASFLEVAPIAQSRIMELLYANKQVLDREWNVKTLEDNDLALKAAEMLLKYSWLNDAPSVTINNGTSKKEDWSIMSAITIDENE